MQPHRTDAFNACSPRKDLPTVLADEVPLWKAVVTKARAPRSDAWRRRLGTD